jgi:hypothetical protein
VRWGYDPVSMRYIEKKRKSIDERRKSGKEERRENIK